MAYNLCKQRHCMSTGNIFAKRYEVNLSIHLHAFAAIGNKQRCVVNVSLVYVDRSQQKVRLCRRARIHDEFVTLLVRENRPGIELSGQTNKSGGGFGAARFSQPQELIENSPGELRIELLILRNVGLHPRDAERFVGGETWVARSPKIKTPTMAAIVTVKSKCGRITRVRASTTRRYAVVMTITL